MYIRALLSGWSEDAKQWHAYLATGTVLGVSQCWGFAVDQSSLLSLYWSVRKGHHKDLDQRTQYSTTQCC